MNRDTAILHNDTAILRELADKYAAIAYENSQKHVWELHASLNDLHPVRPIVLISELPWHELNVDGSLSLRCEDPDFRAADFAVSEILHSPEHRKQILHRYISLDIMYRIEYKASAL